MKKNVIKIHYLLLAGIMVLSFLLNFIFIEKSGDGHTYYASAVKSMLKSFNNFFFVAFDSAGYVSVDKPPVGLWIQTLCAAIFGVKGWSVILPQALAAAFSTLVLYLLVSRHFGKAAGLLSALILAVTPILVATSRTNNHDPLLLLFLLLATWFLLKAMETPQYRWLLLSALMVGLGFNIKMTLAYAVLPAFLFYYLLRAGREKKFIKLTGVFAVLILVSFSWAAIVDLTPPAKRPYVGGSNTNSAIELAIGFNGIYRLFPSASSANNSPSPGQPNNVNTGIVPAQAGGSQENRETLRIIMQLIGQMEGDKPGFLRFFNKQLGGQISWFFILALFAFPAVFLCLKKEERKFHNPQIADLVLWGVWLLPLLLFFSFAGYFHRYYFTIMAPALAALSGIAITQLWAIYKNRNRWWFLLPAALLLNLGLQIILLAAFPAWSKVLIPLIAAFVVFSAGILAAAYFSAALFRSKWLPAAAATMAIAGLLIASVVWSLTPVIFNVNNAVPCAGPELAETMNPYSMVGFRRSQEDFYNSVDWDKMIAFVKKNRKQERFLVSVPDGNIAGLLIVKTGEAIMAAGGFVGTDDILTADRLARMVKDGELRYMMISNLAAMVNNQGAGAADPGPIPTGKELLSPTALSRWLKAYATVVPAEEWFQWKENTNPMFMMFKDVYVLYDLKPDV